MEEDRKKAGKERRLLREEGQSKASDEDGTENTLTVVQLYFAVSIIHWHYGRDIGI